MNLRSLAIVSVLAAPLALWNCFDNRLAGGTIETTNGISARVVLPSGQPASNIKLKLLDEKDWLAKTKAGESIVLDSAVTDSSGKFFIKTDSTISCGLTADVEDYAILIHNVTQKAIDADFKGKIGLRKKVKYQGSIQDTGTHAVKILLAGTTFSAVVDSAGGFLISDVPPEKYSVVILRNLPDQSQEYIVGAQVTLNEFTEQNHDTVHADTSKVLLLENFENWEPTQNVIVNMVGPVLTGSIGGGVYDVADDANYGGNSDLYQPANNTAGNLVAALKPGMIGHGKAFQCLYKTGTNVAPLLPYPMVHIDMNLGTRWTPYNLSGMDSLSFLSGGTGKLIVELTQENPDGVVLNVVASKTFVLEPIWGRYTIKPNDLVVTSGWFPNNIGDYQKELKAAHLPVYTKVPTTWQEMGGMVTFISFKATGGSEFWLDDIQVHGVNVGDLVK